MPSPRALGLALSCLCLGAGGPSFQALAHPHLEAAHAVTGQSVKVGHFRLALNQGRVANLTADGQVVGFFFEGSGSFDYRTDDPVEFAALDYDLKKNTKYSAFKAEGTRSVGAGFGRALVWWGGPAVAFDGPEAPALTDALATHLDRFSRAFVSPGSLDFMAHAWNAPGAQVARAELDAGAEAFVYDYDSESSKAESLTMLQKSTYNDAEIAKNLYPMTLSEQPIGHDRRQNLPGDYMLTHLDVDLTEAKEGEADLKVREQIVSMRPGLRVLRFNLQDNWTEVNGRGGLVPHRLKVAKVLGADGKDLSFSQGLDTLDVLLPEALDKGQTVDLSFRIEGDFLFRPGGDSYWELGTTPWFPQPDLNGQMYTMHTTVRVKKPWQAFAPGNTVRRWEQDGFDCVEMDCDKPIAFGVVLAGDYHIEEETRDGRTIRVATYALHSNFTKDLREMAFHILKYYEGFMGPYPFKEFQILQKNEWGYGQAPASIMFITNEAFNQVIDPVNKAYSVGIRDRFTHEIAHQWWGTVVKMPNRDEQWLTESFAEYSAALCLLDWKGKGSYVKLYSKWRSWAEEASPRATIPTANRLANREDSYELFRSRTGLIYDKGAWLLYCIHKEIGDQAFFTFMKSYQSNFKWRFGSTRDVAGMLGAVTHQDWKPFFEQYYWGNAMPKPKE